MWGWLKPIIDSLLEFIERQVRRQDHAKDAPGNHNGIRDRFLRRVRDYCDLRARRDPGSSG